MRRPVLHPGCRHGLHSRKYAFERGPFPQWQSVNFLQEELAGGRDSTLHVPPFFCWIRRTGLRARARGRPTACRSSERAPQRRLFISQQRRRHPRRRGCLGRVGAETRNAERERSSVQVCEREGERARKVCGSVGTHEQREPQAPSKVRPNVAPSVRLLAPSSST